MFTISTLPVGPALLARQCPRDGNKHLCCGEKSALANHSMDLGHQILFSEPKVLFKSSEGKRAWRLIRESLDIRMEANALNREHG